MISVRKIVFAAAVGLGVAGFGSPADAAPWNSGCNGPYCNTPRYPTLGSYLFGSRQQPQPTFQAAPWYLYWPYDAHFQTPAPVMAPHYAPPGPGNFPVNPYFPAPSGGGYYGPIPGGPAPAGVPMNPGGFGYPGGGLGGGFPGGGYPGAGGGGGYPIPMGGR